MKTETIEKRRIQMWKSADPTWQWYGVGEPNQDTKWFKTYDEAAAYADERARKTDGILVAR